ncbi:phage tail assembly chaperone [Flexibacterium corallicola]|uniref:phage tail assembly chaperone n=1 Tax=Flexibacterium corallicola TaxID=3037259 RepID=UPI0038621D9C
MLPERGSGVSLHCARCFGSSFWYCGKERGVLGKPVGSGASATDPFPWEDLGLLFLGELGWRPRDFWGATPKELSFVLQRRVGAHERPMTRGSLHSLLRQYPDKDA